MIAKYYTMIFGLRVLNTKDRVENLKKKKKAFLVIVLCTEGPI
jgi:catechol-2,3-dioxygenase